MKEAKQQEKDTAYPLDLRRTVIGHQSTHLDKQLSQASNDRQSSFNFVKQLYAISFEISPSTTLHDLASVTSNRYLSPLFRYRLASSATIPNHLQIDSRNTLNPSSHLELPSENIKPPTSTRQGDERPEEKDATSPGSIIRHDSQPVDGS